MKRGLASLAELGAVYLPREAAREQAGRTGSGSKADKCILTMHSGYTQYLLDDYDDGLELNDLAQEPSDDYLA